MIQTYQTALRGEEPNTIFVCKVHQRLPANLERSLFISNERDMRDAMLSYKRFMRCDMAGAQICALNMAQVVDHYRAFSEELVPYLPYRELTADPTSTVQTINRFLHQLDQEDDAEIIEQFSKSAVKSMLADKERHVGQLTPQQRYQEDLQLVPNLDGSIRVFDGKTGFQGGHVSDYQDGSWRTILSADELAWLDQHLGSWFERHGYEPCEDRPKQDSAELDSEMA